MPSDNYTKSDVYKLRLKRGMASYLKFKPSQFRYYLRPGDGDKIRKVVSIFLSPLEYFKRWIFYRLFSPSQSTSVRIGDEGYVTFSVDDIKGGRKFLEEICAFVESKRMQCEDNQFDQNDKYIIPIEEVIKYPFILDFAVNDDFIKIVSAYLKTTPVLYAVQLWHGGVNQARAGSPCFHRDGLDTSCVRIYVYLNDVSEENGPFSIIPKTLSKEVVKKTGYSSGVISDKEMYEMVGRDSLIEVKGPKGTMLGGDPTQCFHYGSRIEKGERLVIIFSYASYFHNDPNIKLSRELLSGHKTKNTMQKMLLNGPK